MGGCCGTTPEHIKAIKTAVRSLSPQRARASVEVMARSGHTLPPVPVASRSRLAGKLARQEFPVLVEVVPPKGCDATKEVEGAQYLLEQGIDAVNIPDGSGATARMSALTLAALLQQRAGIEVLLHYSSRDRNVLTIQSDLLGAHALGVRNLLALTRDTPQYSTVLESDASEVDAIGLVNLLSNLNRGLDVGANPLGVQTAYLVGASVNPYALNLEEELRRFQYKVEAGADFAVTQPVFQVEQLAKFLERARSFAPAPSRHRRNLAAHQFPQRRVHEQRGAGNLRSAGGHGAHARGGFRRARAAGGTENRAGNVTGNPRPGSGSADRRALRPLRPGGGGGAGARRQPDGHFRPPTMIEFHQADYRVVSCQSSVFSKKPEAAFLPAYWKLTTDERRERTPPCPSLRRVTSRSRSRKTWRASTPSCSELEDTDLPLEKALVLYEEGMKLSESCHKQLEEAEGRVEILTKKAGGKMVAEPFATEEKGEITNGE